MTTFNNYNLAEYIKKTLEELNFTEPTPIQELVIPKAIKGNDIIGKSKTGSGKTHSYLLPLLNKVNVNLNQVQAVIITPTRELAAQVGTMIEPFVKNEQLLRYRVITGGLDRARMIEKTNSTPHIVIGTPGRIKDIAMVSGKLDLSKVSTLVIDEADMLLEEGFMDDVNVIAANLALKLQMMIFSATIPQGLKPFLDKYMHNPLVITIKEDDVITPDTITYIAIPTRNRGKKEMLLSLTKSINPFLCLIFASKKEDVNDYYQFLRQNGINAGIIHGDLTPNQRRAMMKRIKNHEYVYVIASDIASRGIDIEGVTHVINIDFPSKIEFFYHRSGRCGRMNQQGWAISLYDKEELNILKSIHEKGINFIHQDIVNNQLVDLKPLFRENKAKFKKVPNEIDQLIKKTVNILRPKKVKPGYKKKLKIEVEKIKKVEKRKIIKKDIERQKKERAILKQKQAKGEE